MSGGADPGGETLGYEARMQADILELLDLFRGQVPDSETRTWVEELAANRDAWQGGLELFGRVRARNLKAIESGDVVKESQYCFEEACLQSLYNETDTAAPFDSCSPYWIIKNALFLARAIGVLAQDVVAVVAPDHQG
jgi:hypothetical protein